MFKIILPDRFFYVSKGDMLVQNGRALIAMCSKFSSEFKALVIFEVLSAIKKGGRVSCENGI